MAIMDGQATLFYDLTDPLSYLLDQELVVVEQDLGISVRRTGFELLPPPSPLLDAHDAFWAGRWASAEVLGGLQGSSLVQPQLVPWTRKAHELHLHAKALEAGETVRKAIFAAFFAEARDIGRVDTLVEIAADAGLDRTEAKAVLDVDRFQADVVDARQAALVAGVRDTPSLLAGRTSLQGFHNRIALSTLLAGT